MRSLFCVTNDWTLHVSRIFHLQFIVELDSNSMESASTRFSMA
jgi:hypothetical protein